MRIRELWVQGLLFLAILMAMPMAELGAQEENGTTEKEETNDKPKKKIKAYESFCADDVQRQEGLFDVIILEKDYFFEIRDSLLGRDMLIGERVAALSSSSKVAAGEMRKAPVMIRFTRDDERVYMHRVVSSYQADADDPVSLAVARTSLDPILHTFDIEALNNDSTAAVIKVTDFYTSEIKAISPFNAKFKAGKLEKNATRITQAVAFPENVELRTYMSYSNTNGMPFSIVVHRSLLLLPEEPMMPRFEDARIGYFSNSKIGFSTDTIGVQSRKFIQRFKLQPKKEDQDRYLAGELVEPEKPIVFYIDDAFPEEWKTYIRAGVEDWQGPFEAIGFKNAIVAKDYPQDDPSFHPEDIRYSCVRYISLPKANSMGPGWIDPRSGEVISGDMLWWHNVLELLRDWRFVQTAAADPKARERNPGMDVLGPMIRYVAAHELGHVLGLKHNMRASYAYPVDSLRSPTFTRDHGTTPSIMDYARFNYVAQPGDGVEHFLPPHMGPYDDYAIEWGYRPISGVTTPEQEYPTLNKWILEKAGNPVYRYGDQQLGAPSLDPASQNEALGDDAIQASIYGVRNARYIMAHLGEWTIFENEDFDYLDHMYRELVKQYNRYMGHVVSYLGGVYIYKLVGGEKEHYYTPLTEEKQREALEFLFRELEEQPDWIINDEVERVMASKKMELMKSQAALLDKIMSPAIFQRLFLYHTEYTCQEYLDDLHNHVWKKTKENDSLNEYERHLQASYVRNLLSMTGGKTSKADARKPESEGLSSPGASKIPAANNIIDPLILQKQMETRALLKKELKQKDRVMGAHYQYLYELFKN